MKLKITFLLLVINSILFSQPEISWIKEYDSGSLDERGVSITETNDNNGYIICGFRYTESTGHDLFLIRTDEAGDTIWTKQYGTSNGNDYGMQILRTGEGYVIGGELMDTSINDFNAWLLKINEDGDSLWSEILLDSARIMSVCLTPDGGIAATGGKFFNGRQKLFIARFNPEGVLLWLNYYYHDYFYDSFGWDIICTRDSGFAVLGGATDSNTVSTEPWLLKTDCNGSAELDTVYDLNNYFMDGNIHQTNSGDFIIAEDLMGSVSFLNINNSGEILDSLNLIFSNVMNYPEIIQAADSNYICMYTISGSSNYSFILIQKTDQNFNTIWTKEISGDEDYNGHRFITSNNSLLLTGLVEAPYTQNENIFLVRLDGDIIPVELIAFEGHVEGNNVILHWKTATEKNNSGFEIERSSAKTNWQAIGFVKGNINSTIPHTYSYVDSSRQSGTIYYRLRQIDLDGSTIFSNIIRVEFSPVVFSLEQNYPNPFNPVTTIDYSITAQENVKLEVYNILGQKVTTLINEVKPSGKYKVKFDAGVLSSGVYIYQLTAGRSTLTKKMLLLR